LKDTELVIKNIRGGKFRCNHAP